MSGGPRLPKKAQFTQERVEYKVFLFDELLKGSKSLKIFQISLTFRFDIYQNFSISDSVEQKTQLLSFKFYGESRFQFLGLGLKLNDRDEI
jgi:uncharacterized UBP type Zn finger protein